MKTKHKKSLFQSIPRFTQEVKQEAKKVTWPSRKETTHLTLFVFIFSVVASLYFLVVDKMIVALLGFIRGL